MINAATLRKLGTLGLSAEQMAGVLDVLADQAEAQEARERADEERKEKDRQRKRDRVHGNSMEIPRNEDGKEAETPTESVETVSLSPVPLLPPTPPKNPLTPKPIHKNNTARGIRLPDDWTMSGPDLAYSISKGLTEREAGALFERFCSWAWSAAGSNAVKRNWHQAWQGWVQRDGPKIIANRPRAGPPGGPPPGKGGFVSILMEKHLERQQNETGNHDSGDFFARSASR